MAPDTSHNTDLILRVLVEGAIGGLVWVVIALRRYSMPILFGLLIVAARLYVVFALNERAGPVWVLIELLGVAIFGAMGSRAAAMG